MVPARRSPFGRPPDSPLPALFVLLGLRVDSGLGYRTFVAQLNITPLLLEKLGFSRAPSYSILYQALKRLDNQLLHRLHWLIARRRSPPTTIAVDSTGFPYTTGDEWMSLRSKKTWKRRFTALHAAVDTDTLLVHAVRLRARPGGDARELVPLLKRVPQQSLDVIYGDKAYISRRNVQFVHNRGAYSAIEPKSGLRAKARGYPAYREVLRAYRRDPVEWKKATQLWGEKSSGNHVGAAESAVHRESEVKGIQGTMTRGANQGDSA